MLNLFIKISFPLLIALTFCNSNQTNTSLVSNTGSYILEKHNGVKFKLDSVTSFKHNCTLLIDDKRWALLNETNNSLYLYSIEDGNILKKISYAVEGPDGVGKLNRSGFLYINQDSIFIYDYRSQILFLTNEQGKVIQKYNIRPKTITKGSAYPYVSTNSPAFFRKPNLIGFIADTPDPQEDHSKLNTLFLYNLSSGELKLSCPRSYPFTEANWGEGSTNYNMRGTYNKEEDAFYYSFPIDKNIYKLDMSDFKTSTASSIQSEYFNKIKPLSKKVTKTFDKLEIEKYAFTTPAFYNLVYDQYRKIYYRFVLHPLNETEYFNQNGMPLRTISIICLDSKFNKLGETFIGNDNYFPMYFVGKTGLFIANKQKYDQNEEYLEFDLFKANTATK